MGVTPLRCEASRTAMTEALWKHLEEKLLRQDGSTPVPVCAISHSSVHWEGVELNLRPAHAYTLLEVINGGNSRGSADGRLVKVRDPAGEGSLPSGLGAVKGNLDVPWMAFCRQFHSVMFGICQSD